MVCESWKEKLDNYLDGELPEAEMRSFDAHLRACPSCTADALPRVQMKRAIQFAGKRFTPTPDFRRKMQQSMATKPKRSFRLGWMSLAAVSVILVVAALTTTYMRTRSAEAAAYREHVFSEVADLHVATLASSSPVDVLSTDRHTVKPWFQGKIPFAFNLPELQNSEFSLLGGRMTYLGQAPGAHLIYDVRKHHISVLIFQERSLNLPSIWGENTSSPKSVPFNVETWSQDGLRFFIIGDASAADIDNLAKLFKAVA
ncbi:MAG: zf-HC2 domain-containing protein [Terriglobales bacterium]|jgi:anti-sigma factor RsiW